MSQIKGILFDKDGTLFDFHSTWGPWAHQFIHEISHNDAALSTQLANALEFDLTHKTFAEGSHFIAGTADEVLLTIGAIVPNMSTDELHQRYHTSLKQVSLEPPVPLMPLLHEFKSRGMQLGIATNDHEVTACNQLTQAGVVDQFDFIAGCDSGFGEKPDPGMQLAFCHAVDLPAHQVIMVGDSLHDLEAGQRAGMQTVGVLTGVAQRDALLPKSTVVLNHIGEIPPWLDTLSS